jgi:molecular chaperone GrpE
MDDNNVKQPNDDKAAKLEERVGELENNWKRALADYKNLEKRVAEEKEAFVTFSNLILISRLLSVLDNLEMLEKHIDDTGLKLTIRDFKQILTDEGLTEVEALGKDFDPDVMDAIESVEGEENKVVEVTQKGYKLKDKLVRPARVKVGKNNKEE